MLMVYPFSFMFLSFTVVSSLLAVSSGHVLGVWVGMEINTLSFIALSIQNHSLKQVESCLKYFLIQSLGSGLWLLGSFLYYTVEGGWFWFGGGVSTSLAVIMVGLLLKLGVAPLFFWVPSVMRYMNWMSCCILATWQKIIPLFMVSEFIWFEWCKIIVMFGVISAVVGGIGGLNQLNLRVLMAYSSIGHVGWMISIIFFSSTGGIIYFLSYFITSLSVFCYLWFLDYMTFSRLIGWRVFGVSFEAALGISLLSLAGIPPFTGFVGKWVGVLMLSNGGMFLAVSGLLIGSLMNLYYYLIVLSNLVVWGGVWRSCTNYEIESSMYSYILGIMLIFSMSGLVLICWV